jgi:uncharacterized protein (DUF3084 family)
VFALPVISNVQQPILAFFDQEIDENAEENRESQHPLPTIQPSPQASITTSHVQSNQFDPEQLPSQSLPPEIRALARENESLNVLPDEQQTPQQQEAEVLASPSSSELLALKEHVRVLLAERAQRERAAESLETELRSLRDIMTKKDQLFRQTDSDAKAMREELIKKENHVRAQETQLANLKEELSRRDKLVRETSSELQNLKNASGGKEEILLKAQSENKQLRYVVCCSFHHFISHF